MRPGVLVTRPLPQAEATAARLSALGYAPVVAPMLRIEAIDPPPALDLDGVQAILVTSAHGAVTLAAATPVRDLPLIAVGGRSANAARDAGFHDVHAAEGDAPALSAFTAERLDPVAGAVLHARGANVARSPLPALAAQGFETRETVLYRAVQAETLPEPALASLRDERVQAVLIYSARTAEALAGALRDAPTGTLAAIGLSETALEPLTALPFAERAIADDPSEASLFAALRSALPTEPSSD